jgi:hypothetical protein
MALKTNFAVKPTLTGELVLSRPVEAADAAGIFAAAPETIRLTEAITSTSSPSKAGKLVRDPS